MRLLTKKLESLEKQDPFEQNMFEIKTHKNVHLGKILEIPNRKVYESSKPIFLLGSKTTICLTIQTTICLTS